MTEEHGPGSGRRASVPSFKGCRPSSSAASRAMRGNRKTDTKPELALRRALWRRGLRYRLHQDGLPGNPDIAFPRKRVAVFVDGDFWHGREWETRRVKLREGSNPTYWVAKIQRNRERDVEQTIRLTEAGWTVVRLWESDVVKDPEAAADVVETALTEGELSYGAAGPTLENERAEKARGRSAEAR